MGRKPILPRRPILRNSENSEVHHIVRQHFESRGFTPSLQGPSRLASARSKASSFSVRHLQMNTIQPPVSSTGSPGRSRPYTLRSASHAWKLRWLMVEVAVSLHHLDDVIIRVWSMQVWWLIAVDVDVGTASASSFQLLQLPDCTTL